MAARPRPTSDEAREALRDAMARLAAGDPAALEIADRFVLLRKTAVLTRAAMAYQTIAVAFFCNRAVTTVLTSIVERAYVSTQRLCGHVTVVRGALRLAAHPRARPGARSRAVAPRCD